MQTELTSPPQSPKFSLTDTKGITCTCGNTTFEKVLMLRTLSRIITGEEKDSLVPVTVLNCVKCHEVLQMTIPPELQGLSKIV